MSTLIARSIAVLLTNLVYLNGVGRLGWSAVPLVLLLVLESWAVLLTDSVKRLFGKGTRGARDVFPIECAFILFFGFFACIVFGPYDSLQTALEDGFHIQWTLISGQLRYSLAVLVLVRLVRLAHDLWDAGKFGGTVRRELRLDGTGWMFLLFLTVMLAPLIARSGPNPAGGLAALVAFKTFGELVSVWAARILGARAKSTPKTDQRQRK